MTEAGWTRNKVTAECIRDTLREQGNVLSPHVVAQCIDDLLKTDSYQQGRVAGLQEAGDLHEQVNTYCDHEPKAGAGGMGVAIRYRDLIRQQATKLAQQAQDEKGVGE